MALRQICRLCPCNVVCLWWVLLIMPEVRMGCCLTIDQVIFRAMNHTVISGPLGLAYDDDQHRTVRVGLDMLFSVEEWAQLDRTSQVREEEEGERLTGHHRQRRQAIVESSWRRYWVDGVIYYEIERSHFSRRDIGHLQTAMKEWMEHTCVQFLPAPPHARNKIVFMSGHPAAGCASHVGMRGGPQKVSLPKGCRTKGVILHELGHVLGFNHEQTRPDRDRYVTIRWENIPQHMTYNFRKFPWSSVKNLGVPYDYLSIMHYGEDSFSGNGRVTMQTRDPRYQQVIGNRRGLSFRDIKSTNRLYSCTPPSERCHLRDKDCPGEGFVSKNCTCWCPTADILTHIFIPYYQCQPTTITTTSKRDGWKGGSRIDRASDHTAGACEDQRKTCQMWAERGECSTNPEYMHAYCRKACGLCQSVTAECRDEFDFCDMWLERGYCQKPSLLGTLITNNCQKTCGVCKTAPGPKKILSCERDCQDKDGRCQEWADRGECRATADYMLLYCRKACQACCK